jgi:predicted Zn-dependent protease
MDLALQGDIAAARANGKDDAGRSYAMAFEKEQEAALLADFLLNPEPGLSILYRSAASLALQCGKLREAERLVAKALSGNPSSEIATELRDLLHQIYAEADDKSDEIYEVRITAAQRPKIQILVQQLGLPVVAVRKAIGHVAL